jgi:hypothetical protein
MFVGGPLNRGNRMATIVADEMENIDAVELAALPVHVMVCTSRHQSKHRIQNSHAPL